MVLVIAVVNDGEFRYSCSCLLCSGLWARWLVSLVFALTAMALQVPSWWYQKKEWSLCQVPAAGNSMKFSQPGSSLVDTWVWPESFSSGQLMKLNSARLRVPRTRKRKVKSFAKLRGLDVDEMNNHYTVQVSNYFQEPPRTQQKANKNKRRKGQICRYV